MFKTIGIYKNIKKPIEFEKYYKKEILPRMLIFPGVIRMDITSLFEATKEQPEGLNNIQLIIETYYESPEIIKNLANSKEGKKIIQLIKTNPLAEVGSFFGKEKSFFSRNSIPEQNSE